MSSPPHLILRIAACLSASCLVAGCSSSDARAQQALLAYQAAAASNNLPAARKALLELVRAKDDVPDYWVELGKLQASAGSFGEAYYAFTRAYELDRSNPELLRAVTELALRAGDLNLAQVHARELEVVSPGNPWVKLTDGWAAISESRFDKALALSDELLVSSPFDPAATVLKSRALIGLNRVDDAEALLTKQLTAQPSDVGSAQMLARLYVRRQDWPHAMAVASRITAQDPNDRSSALLLIEAAFRSGNVAAGRAASARILKPEADPALIAAVLDRWSDYWPSPQRLRDALTLAGAAAAPEQKVAYADYLSRWGSPADAVRLTIGSATLPVTAGNAEANAVLGDALWRLGRVGEAQSRLNAVIAFDPGNARALRARAELELKTGNAQAAILDAQKLVTVLPNSARDRLLLARCYTAAGNGSWANRTLWTAFQDIPADEKIFAALRLTKRGDSDAMNELQKEFDRQQDAQVGRGIL
jgi:predicted Zn-dependent protease